MADKQFKAASSDPADQTAGGFLDDVRGTIMSAKYVKFDYDGKRDAVPALQLKIHVEGRTDLSTENLKAGTLDKARPSKDGKQLLVAGKGLSSKSKNGIFFAALAQHGFPKAKWKNVSEDVAYLEGLECQFTQLQMKGIENEDGTTGKPYNVLTVSEIHKLPWENKGFRKRIEAELEESESDEDDDSSDEDEDEENTDSGSDEKDEDQDDSDGGDEGKDGDEDEDDDDKKPLKDAKAEGEAVAAVVALLKVGKHAKGIPVDDLAPLVFQKVKDSKAKRKIVELVGDEDWLKDQDAFEVKKGKVIPSK